MELKQSSASQRSKTEAWKSSRTKAYSVEYYQIEDQFCTSTFVKLLKELSNNIFREYDKFPNEG